jgi:dihydroneopterin triphosphate diphosphatase
MWTKGAAVQANDPQATGPATPKIPESILLIVHTAALDVLLLERADFPGFWQSITGSRATADEPLAETCVRELREETGCIRTAAELVDLHRTHRYPIYPHWRHRYAAGVTHNVEHVYALQLAERFAPQLAADEHVAWCWLPWRAAADRCFSWTNAQAIRHLVFGLAGLPGRVAGAAGAG